MKMKASEQMDPEKIYLVQNTMQMLETSVSGRESTMSVKYIKANTLGTRLQ